MKVLAWDVGVKNLAFCLMEYVPPQEKKEPPTPPTVLEWNVVQVPPEADDLDVTLTDLVKTLDRVCKEYKLTEGLSRVFIERQVQRSARMYEFSKTIFAYFVIRCVVDSGNASCRVSFLHATRKFVMPPRLAYCSKIKKNIMIHKQKQKQKVCTEAPKKSLTRKAYKERKQCAVTMCETILEKHVRDPLRSQWFASLKKKDDAADAFLMCCCADAVHALAA